MYLISTYSFETIFNEYLRRKLQVFVHRSAQQSDPLFPKPSHTSPIWVNDFIQHTRIPSHNPLANLNFNQRSTKSTRINPNLKFDINPSAVTPPQRRPLIRTQIPHKEIIAIIPAVALCKIRIEHPIACAPAIVAAADLATEVLGLLLGAGTVAAFTDHDAGEVDLGELLPGARAAAVGADVPNVREVVAANGGTARFALDPVGLGADEGGEGGEEKEDAVREAHFVEMEASLMLGCMEGA